MLRLRFTSGLILGVVLGVPAGTLIGLLLLPRGADPNAATSLQVQALTRKLETAKEDKAQVDRQLEQFAKMADQMSASFSSLERRFKSLEEEARLRDTRNDAPAPPAPTLQSVVTPAPEGQVLPTATTTSVIPQPPAAAVVPDTGEETAHALDPQAAAAE